MKNTELFGQKRYRSFDYEMKRLYGCKTIKLPIDAGFGCPNRENQNKGCIFCTGRGSGEFTSGSQISISDQLSVQKNILSKKWSSGRYIAYFQNFTNTYAPLDVLKAKYDEALSCTGISGMAIATRPDCLNKDVVSLLKSYSKLDWVELGLQTIHSPEKIWRRYPNEVFVQAVDSLNCAGIKPVAHVIFGLPGEACDQMLKTVKFAVECGIWGIKIHMLYIDTGAPIYQIFQKEQFHLLTLDEYTDVVTEALAIIPPQIVIHRLTGDGDKRTLAAPLWTRDKLKVLSEIDRLMLQKAYVQGCKLK